MRRGSIRGTLPKMHRIPTLDGWRAIAITMVIAQHYGLAEIGRHGVGIFFVLSGYLITTNLIREREHNGAIDLRSFYIRRFFRLMPCAWLGTQTGDWRLSKN